jgi:hypothetical protein
MGLNIVKHREIMFDIFKHLNNTVERGDVGLYSITKRSIKKKGETSTFLAKQIKALLFTIIISPAKQNNHEKI